MSLSAYERSDTSPTTDTTSDSAGAGFSEGLESEL